ncbi:MAG: radical SAM protein [Deltaproteobacteria bacterium]|nr:radical SAM protein [Deltaproteobacteria bacterium]
MKRHPLRNSLATLIEDGRALVVETPAHERYPVDTGVLSLTSRCNLGCVMCLEPRGPEPVDLPFDEARRFVEIFAGRVPRIWTCAGEALLYPRFFELGRAIFQRGTRLGVGTNGLVLGNPKVLQRCADAGVRWLHVSCHTSRPERFMRLTATTDRRRFDQFVRGLRNVDEWNRDHGPDRRFDVLLQLVLMRPFDEEIEEYLDFVVRHLAHSPLMIRVEPMQPMNAGAEHPELQYDLAELGRIVRHLIEEHSGRVKLEFKSIPLCMLDGSEGASEDLCTRAAGTVVVGNLGHQSGGLQLQCPIGDPADSACAATCSGCRLGCLCPGVMDNPVPEGCAWPRPVSASAVQLLARLGLRTDFAERKFSLVYPRRFNAPDPEAPEPPARRSLAAAPPREGTVAGLSDEQLGLGPESPRRFTSAEMGRIEGIVRALAREDLVAESRVSHRFAALSLRTADRPSGPCLVILEPARASTPCCFAAAGVAVRYNGQLTLALQGHLDRIRRLLASAGLPGPAVTGREGAGTRRVRSRRQPRGRARSRGRS